MAPYRRPGAPSHDGAIDPADPFGPTLQLARSNPRAYAARFNRLPESVRSAWLASARTPSLRVHLEAMGIDALRLRIDVFGARWKITMAPVRELSVAPADGVITVFRCRQMAVELGVRLTEEMLVKPEGQWDDALQWLRERIPEAIPQSMGFRDDAPFYDRSGPEPGRWSCTMSIRHTALGLDTQFNLTIAPTSHETHADDVRRARERSVLLARSLGVPLLEGAGSSQSRS